MSISTNNGFATTTLGRTRLSVYIYITYIYTVDGKCAINRRLGFSSADWQTPNLYNLQFHSSCLIRCSSQQDLKKRNGFGPIELLFSAKSSGLVPKNIHSWQNWPSIWEKNSSFPSSTRVFSGGLSCSVRPCIKPSPTNAFPLGPGALWQFNVRSHLVRSVGWSGGAWDYPLLGFYDVSWRLWALVLVGEHA